MIWARAEGCRVWDADGREYLDLSGGFGVAALGHRNPRVMSAISSAPVAHALGDLADAAVTAELRQSLPWPSKLGVTGADAVEIALRTALLATGKSGIVAFDDAYHGTGLLALAATGFERFRETGRHLAPGPRAPASLRRGSGPLPADTCCVIAEPVQGRAGARVPPHDWLETLHRRCEEAGALLIVDAIYAGLGRIGELWPGEQVADVICVGKALGGGLPLSAALFVHEDLASVWDLVRRTFSRTPTPGIRSLAQPRSSCSTKCRGCSNASASPGAGSRRRVGAAPACSAPAWATHRLPSKTA